MAAEPFSIHILTDVSASIGGGSGLKPMTVRAARSKHGTVNHSATPALFSLRTSLLFHYISFRTSGNELVWLKMCLLRTWINMTAIFGNIIHFFIMSVDRSVLGGSFQVLHPYYYLSVKIFLISPLPSTLCQTHLLMILTVSVLLYRFLAIRTPVFYHKSVSRRRMIVVVEVVWLIIVLSVTLFVTFGQNPELNIGISCTWNNVLKDFVSIGNCTKTLKAYLIGMKFLECVNRKSCHFSVIVAHTEQISMQLHFSSYLINMCVSLKLQVYWYMLIVPFFVISMISTSLYMWVGCMVRKISTQTGPRNIRESKRTVQQRKVLFICSIT